MSNCGICGNEFSDDNLELLDVISRGEIAVCSICANELSQCERCNCYLPTDDIYNYYGDELCSSCEDERTREDEENENSDYVYSYHSDMGRNDESKGARYKIGIEIEKEDRDVKEHDYCQDFLDSTGWCKEEDGSLDSFTGFEVISPILPLFDKKYLDTSLDKIKHIVAAKKSSSCGGHIHVSDTQRMPAELLYDVFRGYTPLFYSMYPNRIGNNYCRTKTCKGYLFDKSRYNAFNIGENTLELRIFPSPSDMKTLQWRLELLRIIVNAPEKNTDNVLKKMLDKRSILYRHLRKIYDDTMIIRKCQLFVEYSRSIDTILTDSKLELKLSVKLKNVK